MATQKTAQSHTVSLTVKLTDEERDLLEAFMAEQAISELNDTLPALLHEVMRLHDALWDEQFKAVPPALVEMGRKALEDYEAGLTEEFDTES